MCANLFQIPQGGPGQSLFYNLLKGTGPWSITDKCEFVERNTSSHKTHHTIYVDNPVCTGFSYTGNCTSGLATNQTEIMNTLLPVIQQFLTLFPNLRQKQFFIQGESYGGKYAVKFAEAVHESNFNCKQPKINLVGVAIGSGLVDPINLSNFTTLPAQISLVDANGAQKMLAIQNEGYRLIQAGQYTAAFSQSVALFNAFFTLSNYNQYFNFAKDGIEDPSNIQTCLDRPDIRKAIHVGNNKLHDILQNVNVLVALLDDILRSVADVLSKLLSYNYRFLIYTGNFDLLVTAAQVSGYISKLTFSGAADYEEAPRSFWYDRDGLLAGYLKHVDNLHELVIRNAGILKFLIFL